MCETVDSNDHELHTQCRTILCTKRVWWTRKTLSSRVQRTLPVHILCVLYGINKLTGFLFPWFGGDWCWCVFIESYYILLLCVRGFVCVCMQLKPISSSVLILLLLLNMRLELVNTAWSAGAPAVDDDNIL